MRIPQDERFRDQAARFSLRFTCEDCAMFDPERGGCAHGYPTVEHRRDRYADHRAVLVFCKDFQLA